MSSGNSSNQNENTSLNIDKEFEIKEITEHTSELEHISNLTILESEKLYSIEINTEHTIDQFIDELWAEKALTPKTPIIFNNQKGRENAQIEYIAESYDEFLEEFTADPEINYPEDLATFKPENEKVRWIAGEPNKVRVSGEKSDVQKLENYWEKFSTHPEKAAETAEYVEELITD